MPSSIPAQRQFHDLLGLLPSLLLTTPDLHDFLQEVARLAALSIGAHASCGITTHYDAHPLTVATSGRRALLIDEDQYGAGEGPCLEAMRTGHVVHVPDLPSDPRWPKFRSSASEHEVHCVLSLPLWVADESVGALNLYGSARDGVFEEEEIRRATLFAVRASTALALSLRHLEQSNLNDQLEQALESRAVIDQALGVIMAEQRCDAETAFTLLRRNSQNRNEKLRVVATELVERLSGNSVGTASIFERGGRRSGTP